MDENQQREKFDTGLKKIRQEIKSRLVPHGLFGTVNDVDLAQPNHEPESTRIEIIAKGKTVSRSFDRQQIESCFLKVNGAVLSGIIAMVDEIAALS